MLRVIVQSNPSLQQWQIDFATSLAIRDMSQIHPWIYTYDSRDYNRLKQSNYSDFIKNQFVSLFGLGGIDLFILGQQQKYNHCERNGVHYAIIDGVNDNIDFEQIKIEYPFNGIRLISSGNSIFFLDNVKFQKIRRLVQTAKDN
ncbi:hypothetical protein AB4K20DRAFT_1862673 [Rhizopus microsporus]|uniref:Uncharacterized protein n=1 Tax=Rhizopus microsporus TaxID=58291 RepID=A0A1X0RZS5_RHIZD|nr:hypothetical protein BCV71DRAFT_235689 [Rhizopus microsporus]